MGRRIAGESEIVGRAHDAVAEPMLPDAVDPDACRQRIGRIGDPLGDLQPTLARLGIRRRRWVVGLMLRDERHVRRRDDIGRSLRVAFFQQMQLRWRCRSIGPTMNITAQNFRIRAAQHIARTRFDIACPKSRSKSVVVLLSHRIKLVVVTSRTLDRESQERGAGGVNQILQSDRKSTRLNSSH